jgi:hypothetical protein
MCLNFSEPKSEISWIKQASRKQVCHSDLRERGTLKMGEGYLSEALVPTLKVTCCQNWEYHNLNTYRCANLNI